MVLPADVPPHTKPVIVNGVVLKSYSDAAKIVGCSREYVRQMVEKYGNDLLYNADGFRDSRPNIRSKWKANGEEPVPRESFALAETAIVVKGYEMWRDGGLGEPSSKEEVIIEIEKDREKELGNDV